MENVLELKNICKSYKLGEEDFKVLNNIDLVIKKGEFVSVLGPSGSGKSTLMNIIGALDMKFEGSYILNDNLIKDLDEVALSKIRNEKIGFVFQNFQLLPRLTVIENIELPLIYRGVKEIDRREKSMEMLKSVGLESKANSYPNQLSGGQQQRVAIARSMVTEPAIILADEPTGALDQKTGEQIMSLFEKINGQGKTIVMITHDINIAKKANRVVKILDGNLIEEGDV